MKAEEIKILNVDDVPYAVSDLPQDIQDMVGFFNAWNQDEVELRKELLKVQSAKRDVSRVIIEMVRKMKAEESQQNDNTNTTSEPQANTND